MVGGVDGQGLHGFQSGDSLPLADDGAGFAHPIDGAPHCAPHLRRNHRGVLMEGEAHPFFQSRAGGADGHSSLVAEILAVNVAPIVSMGHKKGGHHIQLSHAVQLIGADGLRMNHHRADLVFAPAAAEGFFKRVDKLLSGGVAVAVGQQLVAGFQSLLAKFPDSVVGINGIALVALFAPLIGFGHPGRAALGRTIQEYFVSADL